MNIRNSLKFGCANFQSGSVGRREVLRAGAISALGLGLADWQAVLAKAGESSSLAAKPQAKACIFLFMWGGPSQLETFDPKPNAPDEVRSDFRPMRQKIVQAS